MRNAPRHDISGETHRVQIGHPIQHNGELWVVTGRHYTVLKDKPGLYPAYKISRLDAAGNRHEMNNVLQPALLRPLEEDEYEPEQI